MKINRLISSYINGEFYSLSRFSDRPLSWLEDGVAKVAGQSRFCSYESAYDSCYHSILLEREQTVRAPELFAVTPETPRAIKEFCRFVRAEFDSDEVVGVYGHGSIGAGDYIEGISDFDVVIVLRKKVFSSRTSLLRMKRKLVLANRFLYLFDPLQHHNMFVLSEFDMDFFFEPIFPLVLFDYVREMTSFSSDLKFRCLQLGAENLNLMKWWVDAFSSQKRGQFNIHTSFGVKHAVQSVLFLPVVYQQAKSGVYMFKKFVFDAVRDDFSSEEWGVVERAELARRSCVYQSCYPYFFRKSIGWFHYKYMQYLHRKADRNNSGDVLALIGPDFLEEAWYLAKRMHQNLDKLIEYGRSNGSI